MEYSIDSEFATVTSEEGGAKSCSTNSYFEKFWKVLGEYMCKKWIRPTFQYVNGILIEYAEKLIYSASYLLTYGMVSGCSLSVVFRMKLYIWQT